MREERSVDGWIAHGRPVVVASGGRGRGVVGGGGEDVSDGQKIETRVPGVCAHLLNLGSRKTGARGIRFAPIVFYIRAPRSTGDRALTLIHNVVCCLCVAL